MCIEVRVSSSGGYALPYAHFELLLPPGDSRSFVGGATAQIAVA